MFLHLSVILSKGLCLPHTTTPGQTPPGRHPPGQTADTPWAGAPWAGISHGQTPHLNRHPSGGQTPPRQAPPCPDTPLCAVHAGIRSTSGRYASY